MQRRLAIKQIACRLGITARRQGAPDRHVPTHRVTYRTPAL